MERAHTNTFEGLEVRVKMTRSLPAQPGIGRFANARYNDKPAPRVEKFAAQALKRWPTKRGAYEEKRLFEMRPRTLYMRLMAPPNSSNAFIMTSIA